MVVHDLALAAQWADEIVVLSNGALYGAGLPDDILTAGMLAHVYAVQARVERCSQGRLQILVDGALRPPADSIAGLNPTPSHRQELRP
jgi:iron complex transport system ATP-binding protein